MDFGTGNDKDTSCNIIYRFFMIQLASLTRVSAIPRLLDKPDILMDGASRSCTSI
jgi:hypothetical protein